jgi:saccharopine dehydrogenase-like NADP-dependent oxidoreductase
MSNIKNVTIIGSKSLLTKPIISALLPAGFNITILSRAETTVDTSSFPSEVSFKSADYSSHDSLVKAFEGSDAVISLVGPPNGYASQIQLIDAAVSAGVKRFLPSEYGSDFENEKVRTIPLFADKFAVHDHIAKAHKESGLEYDLITTGLFLEIGKSTAIRAEYILTEMHRARP